MNENKIPCGGFRIGDGLTMDGDTLESLSGAYVKVKRNINDGDDEPTVEFMDDSPLKTFEEITQKMETSAVTLLLYLSGNVYQLFCNGYTDNSISFSLFNVSAFGNMLAITQVLIDSDNKITYSASVYTLTPAT